MYGDSRLSDVIATDMNSLLHSDGEFSKMKELVSSDSYSIYNHHEHNHNHNLGRNQNHIQNDRNLSNRQNESSLMRYRSAPSSFYANILEESEFEEFLAPPVGTSSNHEFFSEHQQQQQQQQQQRQKQQQQQQFQSDSCEFKRYGSSSSASMKLEPKDSGIHRSQQMPHLRPGNMNGVYNHPNLESSSTFRSMNSTSSNLIRQSSSPAGFLSTLNSESAGFAGMTEVDKTTSSSRLNNNISFSPGPSSSSMFLPQIPENRNQINNSTFKSLKRTRDGDTITLDKQDGLSGHYTPSLVHHLSLPKISSELAVAEKFFRFDQDLVPTNSRAKRGCATHPRSIAERVRRTRISERMKKLQDLFPNMDKQTSTADMLDMAVQHIKDLQKDVQKLKDARSRCMCSSKQ
ncbi:hypothetical protein L1987_00988 [Smallanthus sonchifolius]|uniref:Uncharacterized protein n=1 Tax=Smallanthus sonchifolius TaxID=185202 RepID=A0ACB9K3W1_9ASTR|nr:hypothetical protein L1987_00988 [Smallanthus sonchifolius]